MSDKWEETLRFRREYRRRWKKYEDIDVKEILKLYVKNIEDDYNALIDFERRVNDSNIIGKEKLRDRLRKVEEKLREARRIKNIPLEQIIKIEIDEEECWKYESKERRLVIRYKIINQGGKKVSINFPQINVPGFRIESYPNYKILNPLEDFLVEYKFKQEGDIGGTLNVDLGKISVNIDGTIKIFPVGRIRMDIVKLLPEIIVEKSVSPIELYEGDIAEVSLKIKNIGRGDAINIVIEEEYPTILDKAFPYRIERIRPNETKEIKYRVKAYRDKVLISKIKYNDIYGEEYFKETNPIKFVVKERPKKEEGKEVKEEKKISFDEIFTEIGKLGLSAAIGYVIGSKIPSKKYRRKKVFIESSLPHTKLKRNGEEVTVVFEHPIAVVHEEKNGIVVLRRANLPEIISSIDGWTAKRLQEIFIDEMAGIFKSWRPSRYVNIGKISTEKYGEEREIEKLKKICEKYGEKIDMKKLGKIPLNPILKTTYEKKGLFGKKLLEAYVYTLSRPEKMYFYNIDHQPFTLTDINKIIEKYIFKRRGNEIILIFASITGWMEEAIEHINGHQDPTIHIMLVDLKTQNVYYNNSKQILRELAEKMGMIEIYIPEISETENLDYLLLTGKIREKQYYKMLQEILAKKGSLEKSVLELR